MFFTSMMNIIDERLRREKRSDCFVAKRPRWARQWSLLLLMMMMKIKWWGCWWRHRARQTGPVAGVTFTSVGGGEQSSVVANRRRWYDASFHWAMTSTQAAEHSDNLVCTAHDSP